MKCKHPDIPAASEQQIESFAAWVLTASLLTGNPPASSQAVMSTQTASVEDADNATVARAIALLPADLRPSMSQIRIVKPTGTPFKGRQTMAYLAPGDNAHVWVPNWTDTFKKAQRGDKEGLIELAGVLAHETYHLRYGREEPPAYEAQIRVLKALGASQKHIKLIQKSYDFEKWKWEKK